MKKYIVTYKQWQNSYGDYSESTIVLNDNKQIYEMIDYWIGEGNPLIILNIWEV